MWAFGCVFYEMLTGQRAFAEDDVSETLAAVLKSEPDWTRIPSDVPPAIRTLIQRCLVKDRRQRVADISAAKFVLCELGNLGTRPATAPVVLAPRSRWQRALPPLAAAAVTAAIVGAAAWALRPVSHPPAVARFSVPLPEGVVLSGTRQAVAISRDGMRMVYAANSRIYLRSLNEHGPRAIPGSETADAAGLTHPVFAPYGESIAFFRQSDQASASSQSGILLRRIPIGGGAASTIAAMAPTFGASWSTEGILVGQQDGIARVAPADGSMEKIVRAAPGERIYGPSMLPGGRTVIFTVAKTATFAADG